jgi:demethylmenaquinone methyltransferase/2-methoxy-6-polyprenyl-1,4-benzoquinol methylase
MFDGIAHRYDLLNHTLSFGIDKLWRKRLVKGIISKKPLKVLDIATGTGDLAFALLKRDATVSVTGVDVSEKMLVVARQKIDKKKINKRFELLRSSAEELPFSESSFDAAMVAFGVRNFYNPQKGLSMIHKSLKPKGTIHILEFTKPKGLLFKWIYRFYFLKILPLVGKKISGHNEAYSYLPESVEDFAERDDFLKLLESAGFINATYKIQTLGIAAIYRAEKV